MCVHQKAEHSEELRLREHVRWTKFRVEYTQDPINKTRFYARKASFEPTSRLADGYGDAGMGIKRLAVCYGDVGFRIDQIIEERDINGVF